MSTLSFFILSLLSPFWALVLYILYLPQKKPKIIDIIIVSFLIAFMGIYFYPWGDNLTHFAVYYSDIVNKYYLESPLSTLFLYDYIIAFIAKITGQYVWGYFFWLFIPFCLLFILLWKKIQKLQIEDTTLLFLLIILFVGVREYLDLNRNLASALIYTSAFLVYRYQSKFISIILFAIAISLHITTLYLLLGTIILHCFSRKYTRKKTVIFLSLAFFMSMFSIPIISQFGSDRVVEMYLNSIWGTGTGVPSGFFYIYTMLNICTLGVLFYFITKHIYLIKNRLLLNAFIFNVLLTLFVFNLWTMRERFMMISIILGITLLIDSWHELYAHLNIKIRNITKVLIYIFCLRIIIVFMIEYSSEFIHKTGSLYPYETISIVGNFIYQPTYKLINVEDYGFSDKKYLKLFERVQTNIED